jgi:hypothetical protein
MSLRTKRYVHRRARKRNAKLGWIGLVMGVWLLFFTSTSANATQDDGPPAASATPPNESDAVKQETPPAPPAAAAATDSVEPIFRSEQAKAYAKLAQDVRNLSVGRGNPAIDATSLFDLQVLDELQVQPEILRLQTILASDVIANTSLVDSTSTEASATITSADATSSLAEGTSSDAGNSSAGSQSVAATSDSASVSDTLAQATFDEISQARRLLDEARLAFYLRPLAERQRLLEEHDRARRELRRRQGDQAISDAEEKAQRASQARQEALEAAQRARSEVERLLSEEKAHLLGISETYAGFEADLARRRQKLNERSETTLSYHRRVREAIESEENPILVDELFGSLRRWLWEARAELAQAITQLSAGNQALEVPELLQRDTLGTIEEADEITQTLASLQISRNKLLDDERLYLRDAAKQIYGEVESLNRDRLALLPYISEEKRAALFGLEKEGFEQAGAELRQISLTLSYHLIALKDWIFTLQDSDHERGRTTLGAGAIFLQWLLFTGIFVFWRRRSSAVIRKWTASVRIEHRQRHGGQASAYETIARTLSRIHLQLAWLVYLWVFLWSIPRSETTALEIELVTIAMVWIFSGSIVVAVIDTVAATDLRTQSNAERKQIAALRLRSLKLVSRTIVTFGVILALSNKLVGEGTIYSWVWSTCWFAAIPVFLVLVRWWRDEAFRRVHAIRKKSAVENWIVQHERGWRSFPAAVAAATTLFVGTAFRRTRTWISRYDITRRALAYFFRRGLDRMAQERPPLVQTRVPDAVFHALGPEVLSESTISGDSDEQVAEVIERLKHVGGGIFAIVGERGIGKTTMLREVQENYKHAIVVDCPLDGLPALTVAIAQHLKLDPQTSLEACAQHLDVNVHDAAILIDNAHRLIRPTMGGLAAFDTFFDSARRFSSSCCWVLAIDSIIWQFLERARGSKPRFDEIIELGGWREEEVAMLLVARSKQAGIAPAFDHLLDRLPKDADEIDLAEAIDRTSVGYYRLLWDYSAGNPGVALHMWRRSLGVDKNGTVQVKIFQAPDTRELEKFGDPAVLVLRAVIQLGPARVSDLAAATMQRESQVRDTLRYGQARGYFEEEGGRYRVTWGWYRAATRFLQRRHLLALDS